MKILALDMSLRCTGWALYIDSKLDSHGAIPEPKYKGKSVERYPQKSTKIAGMMSDSIMEIILDINPDHIVIEEVSMGGIGGVKSIKSLCGIHFLLLERIYRHSPELLNNTSMLSPGGQGWRKAVGLKKNGDFKASAVKLANEMFDLNLILKEHDIADAVLIGKGYIKLEEK